MTNKKYLKENNLYEAHKQFKRLCEWSYVPSMIQEDEDDEMNGQNAPQGDMPPMDGGDPNGIPPQGDNGDMPPMDNGNAPQGDMPPMDGGDPNGMPPQGDNGDIPPMDGVDAPQGDIPPMDEPPMDEPEEKESVIDVDDITNAQEKVNSKVNTVGRNLGQVDDKITSLLQSLDKMQQMIDNNNNDIKALKDELIGRNPLPVEKLNMRSLSSYPYNVKPDEFWRDKSATSNYQAYADNEEPTTQEYEITNDDVDDFDEREISKSFAIDDDMKQDLAKIFNL